MPQYPEHLALHEFPYRELIPMHQDVQINIYSIYLVKFLIMFIIVGPITVYIGALMYLFDTFTRCLLILFIVGFGMLSYCFNNKVNNE